MKKSILILLVAVLAAVPTIAQADNTGKAAKPIEQKATKAVRLSDAELDQITAGKAFHQTGGGLTLVLNPGKAKVGPEGAKITHNNIVCINCFSL